MAAAPVVVAAAAHSPPISRLTRLSGRCEAIRGDVQLRPLTYSLTGTPTAWKPSDWISKRLT